MAMPGRAQQAPGGRFAFADTTLMRDTLGLTFERLFPVADSLAMNPVDLRDLSIRYRYTLERLLKLSDSLHVVVDSVGPVMLRERYNPLATSARRRGNEFTYGSTYNIQRYSTSWENTTTFFVPVGKVLINGNTSSRFDRLQTVGSTNLDQTRTLHTGAGWKFSRNLSASAAMDLSRRDNRARGLYNSTNNGNNFTLSVTNRHQPRPGMSSELSFSGGLEDYGGSDYEKRSLSGGLNGKVRNTSGSWFTHDASASFTSNLGNTRLPGAVESSRSQDAAANLRGTLGLFSNAPIGLNLNYNLRDQKVETPADSGRIQQVLTGGQGIDMSLRFRQDNARYITVAPRLANSQSASATSPTTQNSRRDRGVTVSGRYGVGTMSLDGSFGRTLSTTKYPRRGGDSGGYAEDRDSRTVGGTLQWDVTQRIIARMIGNVSLDRLRYAILGSYPNPPVPRDEYAQSYRVEGKYTFSQRFKTDLSAEVGRSLFVNIPAASTAANTETRKYRANWSWTFRILPALTANQTNTLNANYTYYTFLPASADRLVLEYHTNTIVDADVTHRLRVSIRNDFRYQPTGGYAPFDPPLGDGNSYFSQADESFQSLLSATMNYSLAQALSFSVTPTYSATDRKGITEGVAVPQTATRALSLAGSANLNLPIGRRGQLTGSLSKNFNADHRINYTSGVPDNQPRVETDYWSGTLQLSWNL
jgi:hypothetical protein